MTRHNVTRRELLGLGAAVVAEEFGAMLLPGCGGGLAPNPSPGPSSCSKLTDIEQIVILIQENRLRSSGPIRQILPTYRRDSLNANPAQWAKTALFVAYDENGGFFDHVPPVTAPAGTPGEYVTAPAVPDPTQVGNPSILGPIGLGFRVPMLVISPFSRGGFVSSDLLDHTSILRFLEARFGAEVPDLSAWRRATVGDLTSSFNFAVPNYSVPNLPSTAPGIPEIIQQCAANLAGTTSYPVPNPQSLPSQEAGTPHSPSGRC